MLPSTPHREKIIAYYDQLFDQFGDHFSSVDWKSADSQTLRFEVLLDSFASLVPAGRKISLLDVGCGLGHFLTFLEKTFEKHPIHLDYHGVDLSKKFIQEAKKKHPNGAFYEGDVMEAPFRKPFDVVVASGIFNVNVGDSSTYLQAALRKMFALSRFCVAVNFQSICGVEYFGGEEKLQKDRYSFYHPDEIVGFVRLITHSFVLRHDYLSHDFTVYLYKDPK